MGEEEKKDPPPPSLSKPAPGPPPPNLGKPEATPSMPPTGGGGSVPPVIQGKPVEADAMNDEDAGLSHGATAPLNPRLIAAIIDGLAASGLYFVAMLILPDFLDRLAWVISAAYMIVRDSLPFLNGQGIGKTAMKLKAVKRDGTALVNDWQTAVVRNIPLIIPFFGLIEAIVLFGRESKPERGLRLGDEWAKTKVVVWRPDDETSGEGEG